MTTIGWYVHHHGAGHRTRFDAVAGRLDSVTALSSLPRGSSACEWVALASDDDEAPIDPTAGGALHWVPRANPGLRSRMARISAWIAAAAPDVIVVDVSVEVALLARLHGVPFVWIAQRGRRSDAAHRLAFDTATAIAAPWTAVARAPTSVPARTRFVGAISRFDGRDFTPREPGGDVLLLLGAGGHSLSGEWVRAAMASTPGRRWHVADGGAPVAELLERASVVVGSAGGNVVAEVAAARRPLVCLPQARPFGEQLEQAAALHELGVAVTLDDSPADIGAALTQAEALDTSRWSELHDGKGADRLATLIEEVARCAPRS